VFIESAVEKKTFLNCSFWGYCTKVVNSFMEDMCSNQLVWLKIEISIVN